ncbi:hypothetical protein PGB90_005892 [Kerria lacca]
MYLNFEEIKKFKGLDDTPLEDEIAVNKLKLTKAGCLSDYWIIKSRPWIIVLKKITIPSIKTSKPRIREIGNIKKFSSFYRKILNHGYVYAMITLLNLKLKTKKMPEENTNLIVDSTFKQIRKNQTAFVIWRIENMHLVPLPKDQYGTFYEGDSYLLYVASEAGKSIEPLAKAHDVKGRLEIHIHFWLGTKTSKDESTIAAYKCVELDTYLGGAPVQHREVQGKESARFRGYFKKGIRVLKGGVASGLHHVVNTFEPRLFCVKGRRSPNVTQMPSISWEYFNSGNVFILDTKDVTFVWIGRHSNNIERLHAARVRITPIAQDIRDEHHGVSLIFVDDGKETELTDAEKTLFGLYLNPKLRHGLKIESDDVSNEENEINNNDLKLYKCSEEGGTYKIFEMKTGKLLRSDLNSDNSYIVDKYGTTIWIWVGKNASKKERIEAIRNAHGFIKKKNYPSHIPVSRVVEGGEPTEFKCLFVSWQNHDHNNTFNNIHTGKNKTIPAKLDTETLHNIPKIASETQLVDDGCGKLSIWRVKHSELTEIPYFMYGRFYTGTCYLIHYKYTYLGKEFHILYSWTGSHSSKTEQTSLMLHVMAKDESLNHKGMLVYLNEGGETAHFLSIFHGRMIIFVEEHKDNIPTRFLLHVTGSRQYNTKAKQVPIKASYLDSGSVFILRCSEKLCYVWCGKGSTGDEREMAKNIANKLTKEDFIVVYEGQQRSDFWTHIGGFTDYKSSKDRTHNEAPLLRLFHCSNVYGTFKIEEVTNFCQMDLVSEDVMLLDATYTLYVWIGEQSNKEEKRRAYDLAMEYLRTDPSEKDLKTPVIVIKEGFEPPTFIGYFEFWNYNVCTKRKSFVEIRNELEKQNPILQVELKNMNGIYDFDDCKKFPLEKLLVKNPEKLPQGVDPRHKEVHLTRENFKNLFGMDYSSFNELAQWKKDNLKKSVGLF